MKTYTIDDIATMELKIDILVKLLNEFGHFIANDSSISPETKQGITSLISKAVSNIIVAEQN